MLALPPRPFAARAGSADLLGLYLGDGCLSEHPRQVYKLRITLDLKYPGIIEECRSAIEVVAPQVRTATAQKEGCAEVYAYSRSWPCLFPQHGPGPKHRRPILLAGWQEELVAAHSKPLLRGLVQSDGCRFMNTGRGGWRHPRYSFCNHSHDIRDLFTAACDRLGLHWTAAPNTVYVSRKVDVARLDEFIGPKR